MMAVFGAPDPLADKERRALAAARRIVAEVGALRSPALGVAGGRLAVGVGLATGAAYVGAIRSVDRHIWSAIGNTTNLAARLQALTRDLGARIVIDCGPTTRRAKGRRLRAARRHAASRPAHRTTYVSRGDREPRACHDERGARQARGASASPKSSAPSAAANDLRVRVGRRARAGSRWIPRVSATWPRSAAAPAATSHSQSSPRGQTKSQHERQRERSRHCQERTRSRADAHRCSPGGAPSRRRRGEEGARDRHSTAKGSSGAALGRRTRRQTAPAARRRAGGAPSHTPRPIRSPRISRQRHREPGAGTGGVASASGRWITA
jgi:hypothetical protein